MEIDLLVQTHCKRLRLPTLACNYEKFAREAAQANQPYQQYLLALLEQKVLQREANQERRRIQAAKFPVLRALDSFDFAMVPSVNQAKILELARGDYLAQCENILLVGEIGTGKTHLATALGVTACRQGKRVRFYTAANLVHELTEARDERRLLRLQAQLMKQDLIVLDEVGFVPFSAQGSQLLFQFCSERYQRGSMILTTNLEFPRWTEVFGDPQLTGAWLDRITHHCHTPALPGTCPAIPRDLRNVLGKCACGASVIECHGDSYRFKQSLKKRYAVS